MKRVLGRKLLREFGVVKTYIFYRFQVNSSVIKRNYCESLALWKPTFSVNFQVKRFFRRKFIVRLRHYQSNI